jgi:hypothetical protein
MLVQGLLALYGSSRIVRKQNLTSDLESLYKKMVLEMIPYKTNDVFDPLYILML